MTDGKNSKPFSTAKPGLARDVTKDNLILKAKAFVEIGSGEWVTVGKPTELTNGENRIKEFGAWIAYFQQLGLRTQWYEERVNITVPARWPHMFDADRDVQKDYAAAGVWVAQSEMERRLELETTELTPEQKQRVIARLRAKWWPDGKPPTQKTPDTHLTDLPSSGLDVRALVESAERDLAEHQARLAREKAEARSKGTPQRDYGAFQEGTHDVF